MPERRSRTQLPGLTQLREIAEHPGTGGSRAAHRRRELVPFLRRLGVLVSAILGLLIFGTIGFMVSEGTSVGYGLVWTLDTVATVGSIPEPDSTGGQTIKVLLIVFGVGTLFYALVSTTEFFVAGHLSGLLAERRVLRVIESKKGHILICGFGRVGRQVARDLRATGQEFVVVDDNPEARERAESIDAPFIEGRPSDDEVMQGAGIERASAVLACVDSDAENIFITLTARELRPDITIVARASEEDSENKLKRAGADRVVSPYRASGAEMTRLALHPQVSGVVDVAPEYRMEEIEVTEGCEAVGKPLDAIRGAAVVVALRRPDGTVQPQPSYDTFLRPGDVLVAMGEVSALERMEALMAPATVS
jgi:voltage-gated potassium channel